MFVNFTHGYSNVFDFWVGTSMLAFDTTQDMFSVQDSFLKMFKTVITTSNELY